MRNHLLWSSCLAALLVWALACTKANFAPTADGAGGVEGTGGTTDTGGSGPPPDAGEPCPPPSGVHCSGPSTTGVCDPVCQTGDGCDWCSRKCSYAADGVGAPPQPTCADSAKLIEPFGSCIVAFAGTSQQTDDCLPGYICLPPSSGATDAYCFQLCSVSADCAGGMPCGQRKLFSGGANVRVCDPIFRSCAGTCCDPTNGSGCPGPGALFCYLVSPDLTQPAPAESQTVCEFSSGGSQTSCTTARDCLPKKTCVAGTCRQVCSPTTACASGVACTKWGKEYGYCPS